MKNNHLKKLEEIGIVIEEIYKSKDKDEIFIRTTDGKENDYVYKGIKIEKNYYKNNVLLYREKDFDKDITHTIEKIDDEEEHTCSECGYKDKRKMFFNGCPYCGVNFNINYPRRKSYGKAIKDIYSTDSYKIISIVLTLIIAVFLTIVLIINFGIEKIFDIIRAFPAIVMVVYVFIPLLYFPYLLFKILTIKDIANEEIKYKNEIINNAKLFNDVQFGLYNDYYDINKYPKNKDLIDFDILTYTDYNYFSSGNTLYICLTIDVRKYFFINNKIKKKIKEEKVYVYKNENYIEKVQILKKCPNCGSNVSQASKKCEYCKKELPSNMMWLIK